MRLDVRDFGRHARLRFETEAGVVLAVGRNRVGKTTVRDAVEFALLGTCALRGFALKKDTGRWMVRRGADRAVVELAVAGWAVRRTLRSSGAQKVELDRHGNGGWVEVSPADFEAHLGVTPEAVRLALDAEHFWRAGAEERRALLVALKGEGGVDAARVRREFPADIVGSSTEGDLAALDEVSETAARDGFAAANAVAVERRREQKRRAAEAEAEVAPLPDAVVDGEDVTVGPEETWRDAAEAAAVALADLHAAAARSEGGAAGRLSAAVEATGRAFDRLAGVRLPGSETRVVDVTEEVVEAAFRVERDRLLAAEMAGREASDAAGAALTDAERRQGAALAEAGRLAGERPEPVIETGEWAKPAVCPVSPFGMRCPATAREVREAAAAGIAEAERRAAEREAREVDRLARAEAARVAAEAAIADCDRKRHEAAQARLAWKTADEALGTFNARAIRIMHDVRALDEARAAEAAAREAAESATAGPTAEQVAEQRGRLDLARARHGRRLEWETRRDRNLRAEARAEAHRRLVEWWDRVERELRPEGVEARLAAESSGSLGEWLARGKSLAAVEVDDSLQLTVNGWPVAGASKSEQICAGAVLQVAAAGVTGAPVVVVDEVDALDVEWTAGFAAFVEGVSRGASFPIVALATSEASPPSAPPPGFATVWLWADGARVIEGRQAEDDGEGL